MGVPYVAVLDSVRGIVLRKAARRRSTLNTGDTKTVNGITYTFNENRRWTRADKKSRSKPRSPKAAVPVMNMTIPVIDQPKVKGKPKAIAPMASNAKLPIEATAKQARRTAPRAMSVQGMPELKPKGKPAQIKPKGKTKPQAERKPKKERKLKQKEATTSNAGYLQATNWNPHAIPDLTVRDFRDYLDKKRLITEPPTGTFDETKRLWEEFPALGRGQSLTPEKYNDLISKDILDGYVPSDAALNDANLTNVQLKQVEENRKQHEQWKKQLEPIDKAVNYSMSDEKADKEWSPQMTEEESDAYTSDGFFGSMKWYHGNREETTQSIATEGAQPELNRRGIYGQGVYFGINRSIAEDYAAAAVGESEIITARIRAKRPYVTTSEEFDKIPDMLREPEISLYLQARGYDSLYLQDLGFGVAYDTKQVVTTARENVTKQKAEIQRRMALNSTAGRTREWKKTPEAQALAAIKPITTDRDRLLQPGNAIQQ